MMIWLTVQLALLGMGVLEIRMSDLDRGKMGLEWMVGGQIVAMSLLFGRWMTRWEKVGVWIATCWPMGILAGLITGRGMAPAIWGEIYVSIWFLTLGLWRWIGKNAGEGVLGLLGGLVVLGGGVVGYLRSEMSLNWEGGWGDVKYMGPLTEGMWILDGGLLWGATFLFYGIGITGLVALMIGHKQALKKREQTTPVNGN